MRHTRFALSSRSSFPFSVRNTGSRRPQEPQNSDLYQLEVGPYGSPGG